jgi:hypothetical protein
MRDWIVWMEEASAEVGAAALPRIYSICDSIIERRSCSPRSCIRDRLRHDRSR